MTTPNTAITFDTWAAALLSGDYKRGYQALKSYTYTEGEPAEYCCLGVLQKLVTGEDPPEGEEFPADETPMPAWIKGKFTACANLNDKDENSGPDTWDAEFIDTLKQIIENPAPTLPSLVEDDDDENYEGA